MEKKLWLISALVIVVLFGGFIIYKSTTRLTRYLPLDKLKTEVKANSYSFVHIGEINNKDKETLAKSLAKKYHMNLYYVDNNYDQIKEILKGYPELSTFKENDYILYLKDKPVTLISDEYDETGIRIYLDKYILGIIPDSERYYKSLSTAAEYIKKFNSKEYTIAVFGAESCSYCGLYLPVINNVAKEHKLDIYYFDLDNYKEEEYKKIQELDITIPAECTVTNKDTKISEAYPKPMTLITRKGKLEGCIRGYVTEEVVIQKLKDLKIIKE